MARTLGHVLFLFLTAAVSGCLSEAATEIPGEVASAALPERIHLLLFDVDGVLTDGRILMHADGSESKQFSIRDGAALVVTVAMYGGIQLLHDGDAENAYLVAAREAPSPLGPGFDEAWFAGLLAAGGVDRLSAKAFLATEQRTTTRSAFSP